MYLIFFIILLFLNSSYSLHPNLEFQKLILNGLGLKQPPIISSNADKKCLNYFNNLKTIDYDEIRCFDQSESNQNTLKFLINSSFTNKDKLVFRILIDDKTFLNNNSLKINLKVSTDNNKELISKNIDNKWLEFNILSAKLKSLKDKNVYQINEINFNVEIMINGKIENLNCNESFLLSFSNKKSEKLINTRRKRRQTDETDLEDEEDLGPYLTEFNDRNRYCESVPIYYKFEDYGWDNWIISPKGFMSNFCQGRCSFPLSTRELNGPTNHAIVQSLMQLMYPEMFPEPCCSAYETDSLQIAYFDKKNIVKFKRLDNIIIKSCRCT